ncbi:hypothetical protein [Enterococcus sp. BWR-S5]|uniref:hypothetical protein n=1 Tax=Enterococcus sp. BWR-S5 TaxID=2787714 RepID=UPI001F3CCCE1|nr:hypothetical protein [Enterococcus sp. BWR-S5]
MYADKQLIEWLSLENDNTDIKEISKKSGVKIGTLYDLKNGKTKIENMNFSNAAKLTSYALEKIKNQELEELLEKSPEELLEDVFTKTKDTLQEKIDSLDKIHISVYQNKKYIQDTLKKLK